MTSAGQIEPRMRLKVLLVDRSEDTLEMYSSVIAHCGHESEQAASGEAAFLVATAFSPDVVVTSMALPGVSGIELALKLRKLSANKNMKLILLTGWSYLSQSSELENVFDHVLRKPVPVDVLCDLLDEFALTLGRTTKPAAPG